MNLNHAVSYTRSNVKTCTTTHYMYQGRRNNACTRDPAPYRQTSGQRTPHRRPIGTPRNRSHGRGVSPFLYIVRASCDCGLEIKPATGGEKLPRPVARREVHPPQNRRQNHRARDALWNDPEEEDEEDDNPRWRARKRATTNRASTIIDAVELAFPTPKGWKATSHGWESEISSLEGLTIRKMTKYCSPYHSSWSRGTPTAKKHRIRDCARHGAF